MSKTPGVFVVGMHCSGTSALSNALVSLGMHGPADPVGSPNHPRGLFESRALVTIDNSLLRHFDANSFAGTGRSAWLPDTWSQDPWTVEQHDPARIIFGACFPTQPWVCKDPRLSLVLPFWRDVVSDRAAAVLVVRHPVEVVRSLEARDGLPWSEGLTMWYHYLSRAVRNLAGMQVLVSTYDGALDDPHQWREATSAWLQRVGIELDPDRVRDDESLDSSLRHQRVGPEDAKVLSETQQALYERLLASQGSHDRWEPFADLD
jgi:hypothetical protein